MSFLHAHVKYHSTVSCLVLLISTAFFTSGLAKLAPASIDDGVLAYYPFAGNADDHSGNGYDASVEGAVLTADREENANSAYFFDNPAESGTNRIEVIDANGFNGGETLESLSISLWFYAAAEQNDCSYLYTSHSTDGHASLNFRDGEVGFALRTTDVGILNVTILGDVSINEWHHAVGTWDGSVMSLYVDCELKDTAEFEHNLSIPTAPFEPDGNAIGANPLADQRPSGHECSFYGDIDEVRIYDRALSEAEIDELCEADKLDFCCESQIAHGSQDCINDENGVAYHTDGEKMCGPFSVAEVIHYWAKNGYPDLLDDPTLECSNPAIWEDLVCGLCSRIPTCWFASLLSLSPRINPNILERGIYEYFRDSGVTVDVDEETAEWSTIKAELDERRPVIYYDCNSPMVAPPGTNHFAPICGYVEEEGRRDITVCSQDGPKADWHWDPDGCDRLILVKPGVNPSVDCGMGVELAFLLPPLMWLHGRWRRRRA